MSALDYIADWHFDCRAEVWDNFVRRLFPFDNEGCEEFTLLDQCLAVVGQHWLFDQCSMPVQAGYDLEGGSD